MTAVWLDGVHSVLRLPGELQVIENEAFMNDTSLDEVALPASVTRIGDRAFAGSSIRRINLPASLTYIGNDAFDGCELEIVTAEGEYALTWCADHGIQVK